MPDPLVIVLVHSCPKSWLVNDFADVFIDECVGGDGSQRTNSIALFFGLDDVDRGIFEALEAAVAAVGAAVAVSFGAVCAFH